MRGIKWSLFAGMRTKFFFANMSFGQDLGCEQQAYLLLKTERANTIIYEQEKTSVHSLKFCEDFEHEPNFASTVKF